MHLLLSMGSRLLLRQQGSLQINITHWLVWHQYRQLW